MSVEQMKTWAIVGDKLVLSGGVDLVAIGVAWTSDGSSITTPTLEVPLTQAFGPRCVPPAQVADATAVMGSAAPARLG